MLHGARFGGAVFTGVHRSASCPPGNVCCHCAMHKKRDPCGAGGGSFERHSSNRIYVPAAEAKLFDEHKNSIPFEELRDGDRVKVVYDGAILETYPGQIGNCYEIRRVGRAETSSATEL